MKKKLAIFGAGGLGKEVLSLALALPEWEVVGFYDDALPVSTTVKYDLRILGGMNELRHVAPGVQVVLAIGSPKVKQKLIALLAGSNLAFATLVHPLAVFQDTAHIQLGEGTIVCAGTIVTTDVVIGSHVLINLNCTVGHDVAIGTCTSIMPGVNVAGDVHIGDGVLVGSGATVINRVSIGDHGTVGAGAVVIRDVARGTTVVGVPARPINHKV